MKKVKIFFPLDVPCEKKAQELVGILTPFIDAFKVGLELEKSIGAPSAIALAKKSGREVFADFKLKDIPNTVKGAAAAIARHGVDYLNVLADGGQQMMEAAIAGAAEGAREAGCERPKVIAVTVLTSLGFKELWDLGIRPEHYDFWATNADEEREYISNVVKIWAEHAVRAGVDCLLCSPWEAPQLREEWPNIEIICPGIRLPSSPPDDQKRTATPGEAVMNGADGLVIGRPIRNPPDGKTRQDVIREIQENIAERKEVRV